MTEDLKSLLGDKYILAVEDSLVQAKRLEFFFKKSGLGYKIFPNAEEAFEAAKSNPPAILISDVIMPGMNGYEFCKAFKSVSYLSDIPVILLTSLQESRDIVKGLQAGANNILTKPYDEKSLLKRIENLLSNHLLSSEDVSGSGINVKFMGELYHITSGKKQLLDLLFSVYETSLQRNEELESVKSMLEKSNSELAQANNDLDCISKSVSSVIDSSRFVKDLLSYVQSGNAALNKESVDLSEIAQEVVNDIQPGFLHFNPAIEIEPKMLAIADSNMTKILFNNLLNNAFELCRNCEKPSISIGQKDHYGSILFFIKDNGIGLDSVSLDNFFKSLGLSTVKRIVDKHNGQIWVESEIGKGSTVFFTLG